MPTILINGRHFELPFRCSGEEIVINAHERYFDSRSRRIWIPSYCRLEQVLIFVQTNGYPSKLYVNLK